MQCTPDTLATLKPGEPARVATSLVVREDSLTLFGFGTEDERNVFELLQTASGIGPRLALAMLAVHSPDALRRAVAAEDVKALTMVPGVGNKGAQRIILELKDRLGAPSDLVPGNGGRARPPGRAVLAGPGAVGLVNLGWSARDAEAAIAAVEADYDGQARRGQAGRRSARRGHRAARRPAEAVQRDRNILWARTPVPRRRRDDRPDRDRRPDARDQGRGSELVPADPVRR